MGVGELTDRNADLLVFQKQKEDNSHEQILNNKPLTEQLDANPPKYFETQNKKNQKRNGGTKKYRKLLKRQKEKEIQEMILKNKMYPQKYQNTYFITDKEQIGLLYDKEKQKGGSKTKKKRKVRAQERLVNIMKAGNLEDPEKLKQFLEEDRKITNQKKKKYLSNAKKKAKIGTKKNSIHLKFFKNGANTRMMMPKVHDNRIAMLMENEKERMHYSAKKLDQLRNDLRNEETGRDVDLAEANRFYLSRFGLT